ncbi:MAG: peptidase M4 family protein, partial [Bacteroidetes bacterium]
MQTSTFQSGLPLLLSFLWPLLSWGQPNLARLGHSQQAGWITFHQDLDLDAKTLWDIHGEDLGLGNFDAMQLTQVQTDALGWTHYRFQLYHRDVPVEGAVWMVHSYGGRAVKANGLLPEQRNVSTSPTLTRQEALALALQHMGALTYMWEDAGSEAALQHARHDEQASFYPEPELLIADTDWDPANETPYQLVWKVDVYAAEPHSRKWIYLDAQTGTVIKDLEVLHTANSTGTAVTRYAGTQTIITDSTGNGFRLRESNRGQGVAIETYDMNQSRNFGQAVDFEDEDNYWDNVNPQFDEVATDAHWGAEVTYDYFLLEHNRNSFDDNGSPVISYVHYDTSYFNAFWNGQWMTFGDGNNAPLTTLDVLAHEFAHGVTGNSAALIYAYESGALNESFSDIFGNAIEYYGMPQQADWRIGEGFGAFRHMGNPGFYGDPDTYKGSNWISGTFDNGGVHINSGVQNYWFYLLVEGGSGTNDKGEDFSVTGIGWEKAANIAYRNLTTYLGPASQFADAREGAIQAAADLYGACSPEYQAVTDAWHAVGVGERIQNDDFGVVSIDPLADCGLGEAEPITIRIKYYGCDTFPGGQIFAAYFVQDPNQAALEPINLPPVAGQSVFVHQFAQTADFSDARSYRLFARTLYPDDPRRTNDSSDYYFLANNQPVTDELIGFESFPVDQAVLDTVFLQSGEEATARIKVDVGRDGTYGLLMEGGSRDGYQIYYQSFNSFDLNPAYTSKACLCVDATNMTTLTLRFDLRQTFSPFREINLGLDSTQTRDKVNTLRITANGDVRASYSPTSHSSDPWQTQGVMLNGYTGSIFQLCFENNANQSLANDAFDIGDRTFLDNIFLEATFVSTSLDLQAAGPAFTLLPNPSRGRALLRYEGQAGEAVHL